MDKSQISTKLRYLLDDVKYWYTNNIYSPDELTIRFKHLLVAIHCFPNGNGRHSRLIADIVIEKIFKQPVYTWGLDNLVKQNNTRVAYLAAIRAADNGYIHPLLQFSRS